MSAPDWGAALAAVIEAFLLHAPSFRTITDATSTIRAPARLPAPAESGIDAFERAFEAKPDLLEQLARAL